MTFKKSFGVVAALVVTVLAASRTSPPSGSITVCSSGCNYNTIQKAVSSISTSSKDEHSIFIYSGTYTEQVTVPVLSGKLNIYGYTTDTTDYSGNVVNLEWKSALATGAADDEHTAALINTSPNVAVYNINIKNTYGKPTGSNGQAIALSAYNTEQGYYGVGLYGYQDTLLAQTGNQIYANCYIEGAVDYIFGQHARAWITNSKIASIGAGAITASGRASSSDTSYYVITDSTIEAGSTAPAAGTVYLGRPWGAYARVAFQRCSLSNIINSAGWEVWSTSDTRTQDVSFEEYSNTGDGAKGTRASFSTKLSSAITIATILGSDYAEWVDSAYL
ncbi:Pectinesterase [Diaporthe amygdali]|uniref:Pectinesterase n=1 Tax=Phomopsis amygdali TaxID=1214568 RepID=UPI0022FDDD4C|nr:Pectinesterase [Diaporthe amygdali]KAJ0118698.1 Pectinesterase [Diaporthe amygdali]